VKLLSIVWYKVLPPKFGGQKGIAHFNYHLALHYPLVCICSSNNEPAGDLPYTTIPVLPVGKAQFLSPRCWKKIREIAHAEKITHIILEHPYHGIAAIKAAASTHAKLIVHSHNIESERFRRLHKWWWRLLRVYEKWVHRHADLSLFKTLEEKEWAIANFSLKEERCLVIPYSTGMPARREDASQLIRQRHQLAPEQKIILFAGTLDYEPNAIAVERIYSTLAPALAAKGVNARIIICGRNRFKSFQYLDQLSHPMVIAAGEVVNIEDYFSAASVFINPVETGGGIQTKTIDAIACHCNVVSFESGLTGIDLSVCGTKIFSANNGNWAAFASQVIAASEKSAPTPAGFFDRYSPERSIAPLLQWLSKPVS
jgi:glycosyltransferase involved in cell wall biosynthesis